MQSFKTMIIAAILVICSAPLAAAEVSLYAYDYSGNGSISLSVSNLNSLYILSQQYPQLNLPAVENVAVQYSLSGAPGSWTTVPGSLVYLPGIRSSQIFLQLIDAALGTPIATAPMSGYPQYSGDSGAFKTSVNWIWDSYFDTTTVTGINGDKVSSQPDLPLANVPIPGAFLLFGTGASSLVLFRRRGNPLPAEN